MKQILLALGLALSLAQCLAQAPQTFFYQAVARNTDGTLLNNQTVSFRLAIRSGSLAGPILYQEIHPVNTNEFGLVNLNVGTGLVVSGAFASIDWSGASPWLEIEFDPAGGFAFQPMGGSQLLSVPYALFAASAGNVDDADADPTNEIQDISLVGNELSISNGSTVTLPAGGGGGTLDQSYNEGGPGAGRIITANAGAVEINSPTVNAVALDVKTTANGGVSVRARNQFAGNAFSAVQAETNSNSTAAAAVLGNSTGAAWGVSGQVAQTATSQAGVYGSNLRTNGGHGVLGIGYNGSVGQTNYSSGYGMYAENFDAIAPLGLGVGSAGIGYYGVLGEDRYLGAVGGAFGVYSNGNFGSSGVKAFCIDHPQDPENKFLLHFSMESPEVLNVYRGTNVAGPDGKVRVELPDYYDAINRNPSYQLTPIGSAANLFIEEELKDGVFVIGGAQEGMKVSWMVMAERNDPYLEQYPHHRTVEQKKDERSRGHYLIPALYGKGEDQKLLPPAGRTEQVIPQLR